MIDFKKTRNLIRAHASSGDIVKGFLVNLNIDVTRDGFFKVRDESTPSCQINKDGSSHDYGTGEHYGDIVSLLFDGYHAFDSLPETMEWLCNELEIDMEAHDG